MKDQLLDIDVRLLVLRHGRKKVINALAKLVEQPPEQLEQEILAVENSPPKSHRKIPKLSLTEIAASESRDRPETTKLLQALAIAYENKLFLPNLRDVQRFLERLGTSPERLKSRAAAGPDLMRALSRLPADELRRLPTIGASTHESDYAILSRAIMGSPPENKRNP